MNICIVIQSEAFRTSAGMRIRYDRFRANLAGTGATIDALTIAELSAAKTLDHDVYIFCKTFDTAALLLARRLRAAGKVIGQDVFDDYFSQYGDQRLQRFRQWMRDMAPVTQFAICSTVRLVEVLKPYMPDIPITAIEDPVSDFDAEAVANLVEEKIDRARKTRSLDIVWFGIGDNPYFPVGLADLAKCEPRFAEIERRGWSVNLRIVTNVRPFEGGGAEILRALSVGFELVEWSEEVERDELRNALVAIIPVNAQSFSRAKSMNRAVTALIAGCQVLSVGYPLYQALDAFIYRSTAELLSDVESGDARVRASTAGALLARLRDLADPREAALNFVRQSERALADDRRTELPNNAPVCLLHGRTSGIALHKMVSALGGLSVHTIFSKGAWNFPVRFDRLGREIVMRTTADLAEKYALPVRNPDQVTRILSLEFVRIDTAVLGIPAFFIDLPDATHPILGLAVYEDVMRFAEICCRAAFPGADVLVADSSPFSIRRSTAQPAYDKSLRPGSKRRRAPAPAAGTRFPGEPVQRRKRWQPPVKVKGFGGSNKDSKQRALRLLAESELFDSTWYLERYPDVASSGIDPAQHYLEFGWQEGRNPSRAFATRKYLKAHTDVAEQGINPLIHYIEYGQAEGRMAPSVPSDPVVP